MKLIRLTTTDENALFSNSFNEDINIPANSKVALHSLTTQVQTEQIVIDALNDDIVLNFAGINYTIHLEHNTYDKTNIDDFFLDFTYKCNAAMQYSESTIGRQWLASTAGNIFTLQLRTGAIISPIPIWNNPVKSKFLNSSNVGVNVNNKALLREGGTDTTFDSYLYFKSTICKGVSTLRARLYANDVTNQGGFLMGYYTEPLTEGLVIEPTKIKFGIQFIDELQNYRIYKDGQSSISAELPKVYTDTGGENNDYLLIDSYQGQLYAKVYNENIAGRENGLIIDTLDWDHTTELYPFLCFVSQRTLISDIKYLCDPFYTDTKNTTISNLYVEEEEVGGVEKIKSNKVVNSFLQFNDIDLAKLIGFRSQRIPISGFVQTNAEGTLEYKANNILSFRDIADTYLVEMLNLNINSFDSIKKQHMNLLAVIPQFDSVRERLVYNAVYPVFLSLNNPYPINLREFRCRILKEDLQPLNTIGYSQITILIDN